MKSRLVGLQRRAVYFAITGWPPPELAVNINTTEVGNLGLNHREELAIVAYLTTLSDGYMPKK